MTRQLRMRWRSLVLSAHGPKAPPSSVRSPVANEDGSRFKRMLCASTAARRLTAVALVEFMNADGTGAYPSERTLETMTGLDRRVVRAAMAGLVADCYLSVRDTGRKGNFGMAVREYCASFPERAGATDANGTVDAPLRLSGNGTATDPLRLQGNGAIDARNGTVAASQRDSHCPSSSLNQIKKEEGATRPAPDGAARAPETTHEKVVAHYVGLGYPRETAERCAHASRVVAKEHR